MSDTFAATAFKDDGFRLNSAAFDEMGKSRTRSPDRRLGRRSILEG
ncbi:hypothetical protein [Streptomyces collinus]